MWSSKQKKDFEKYRDKARGMVPKAGQEPSWNTGLTVGLLGGAVGIIAVAAYLIVKSQGKDTSYSVQGQKPGRSHIRLS